MGWPAGGVAQAGPHVGASAPAAAQGRAWGSPRRSKAAALAWLQQLAAAAAVWAVPAAAEQGDGEAGRRDGKGGQAALGRTAALRELAQGGPAACAGGEQGLRGGAAAPRRRQGRNRKGNGSGSKRRLLGISPGARFGRGRAGGGSSV
ncbi:uncharacterized protein LOC120683084 [Panicum virgatum]|uniref:uncharacterized protein LOC120683084 n=1 Tax=Panicum virgatum TaxID=38727 RepID=UPI0019D602D8|nr:uncharacterized protein LOC120683084 [Panicum virgatum]